MTENHRIHVLNYRVLVETIGRVYLINMTKQGIYCSHFTSVHLVNFDEEVQHKGKSDIFHHLIHNNSDISVISVTIDEENIN